MSREVLRETVRQVMEGGGQQVSFAWQGGEPTLMGVPFFEQAVRYQAHFGHPGQAVGNGLQTNGVLIDENWIAFLREHRFLVGLSLDGPEHIHNRYRGKSWRQTAQARDLLLSAGVAVNALIVVNDYSVRFPREIYAFHKKSGLNHMQFIPCVETGADGEERPAPFSVPPEQYGVFLCELFDLWRADFRYGQPRVFIRWFDSLFYSYVNLPAPECTLLSECGSYLVVEHNGDVYTCDFYVEPEWRLGNVMDGKLVELLNGSQQGTFGRMKSQWPRECESCIWLHQCHGGCPRERCFSPTKLNYFCSIWKMFFQYTDSFFKKLAEQWQQTHSVINH